MKTKNILTAIAVAVLFVGCSRMSTPVSYRFAGETQLHQYQVHFNWWVGEYTLIVDGVNVMEDIHDGASTTLNGKRVSVNMFYNPGLIFIGNSMTVLVFVENEKVAQIEV